MADSRQDDPQAGQHELPEAFTMNQGTEVSHLAQPPAGARSRSDLDVVREGSEESFPASDPPSPMASTSTVPSEPVKPQE